MLPFYQARAGQVLALALGTARVRAWICPDYCGVLRARVRKFCEWLGRPATIADLAPKVFNEWLTALQKTKMARNTIEGYRRSLLCIWRDAYESELTDVPAAPH